MLATHMEFFFSHPPGHIALQCLRMSRLLHMEVLNLRKTSGGDHVLFQT